MGECVWSPHLEVGTKKSLEGEQMQCTVCITHRRRLTDNACR